MFSPLDLTELPPLHISAQGIKRISRHTCTQAYWEGRKEGRKEGRMEERKGGWEGCKDDYLYGLSLSVAHEEVNEVS